MYIQSIDDEANSFSEVDYVWTPLQFSVKIQSQISSRGLITLSNLCSPCGRWYPSYCSMQYGSKFFLHYSTSRKDSQAHQLLARWKVILYLSIRNSLEPFVSFHGTNQISAPQELLSLSCFALHSLLPGLVSRDCLYTRGVLKPGPELPWRRDALQVLYKFSLSRNITTWTSDLLTQYLRSPRSSVQLTSSNKNETLTRP